MIFKTFFILIFTIGFASFSHANEPDCEKNVSEKSLKDMIQYYMDQAIKKDDPNRHRATLKLNTCSPSENSKALIIAFEGTGAYEPIIPPTMANLNKCLNGKLSTSLEGKLYHLVKGVFKDKLGRDSKWSGLQAGIMSSIGTIENSSNLDCYSFPSEEVEQLAGLEKLKKFSIKELYRNIKDSINSNPKGIQNARSCIKKYIKEANKLKIEPYIVLVSHSSGGRSLVKFSEHIKRNQSIEVDLAFSIDPIKEAHHAVQEVLPQKLGEPLRYARWRIFGEDYPYSAVWHRHQPSKLYKPGNVKEHLSFYQLEDREGLKIGGDAMRFAIQGSKMDGADNFHIKGLGTSAHGEITYHPKVLKMFLEKIELMLK